MKSIPHKARLRAVLWNLCAILPQLSLSLTVSQCSEPSAQQTFLCPCISWILAQLGYEFVYLSFCKQQDELKGSVPLFQPVLYVPDLSLVEVCLRVSLPNSCNQSSCVQNNSKIRIMLLSRLLGAIKWNKLVSLFNTHFNF